LDVPKTFSQAWPTVESAVVTLLGSIAREKPLLAILGAAFSERLKSFSGEKSRQSKAGRNFK